jgi:putative NIF3 family GTP cyclohydrolase 1 type 2
VKKLVLSITPTESVYAALGAPPLNHPSSEEITAQAPTIATVPIERQKFTTASATFLHRPWTLTRPRLPRGTTVWSSHKGFDEGLTVGCNFALLERLGADVDVEGGRMRILVGYKGDEGRRVGVVAGFREGDDNLKEGLQLDDIKGRIIAQFGELKGEGGWFGFDTVERLNETSSRITSIANMNAFHPAEVERVAAAAFEAGFVASRADCRGLVYLTGAVREEGLEAALARGMRVVCVGHRLCEVWGIGYLAERVRERWPGVDVRVVDEEEIKPVTKEAKPVLKRMKERQLLRKERKEGRLTLEERKEVKQAPREKRNDRPLLRAKEEVESGGGENVEAVPGQTLRKGCGDTEVVPAAKSRRTSSEDQEEEGGVEV